MNTNEISKHEVYFNLYMDAGYSVADAFDAATHDVRVESRIESRIERVSFADAGIYGN